MPRKPRTLLTTTVGLRLTPDDAKTLHKWCEEHGVTINWAVRRMIQLKMYESLASLPSGV